MSMEGFLTTPFQSFDYYRYYPMKNIFFKGEYFFKRIPTAPSTVKVMKERNDGEEEREEGGRESEKIFSSAGDRI